MRVYLASSYSRRLEMVEYARQLEALGVAVTSSWIDGHHETRPDIDANHSRTEASRWAWEDLNDINRADALILFTNPDGREIEVVHGNQPPEGLEEEWRAVPGSRLGYEVSNLGRARNGQGELISGHNCRGYRLVRPNGKHEPEARVHQLVAAAFIGECPPEHVIDHLDSNKRNNWVGNLEYVTRAANTQRAEALGLIGHRSGTHNGRAKLTWEQVADIRAMATLGKTKAELAREYGVSDVLIGRIVRGEIWQRPTRGGHFVEFGYALGRGLSVYVVGPRDNIFTCLPQVAHAEDWAALLAALIRDWRFTHDGGVTWAGR